MIELDRSHLVNALKDRLSVTDSPRQRTMLERMIEHAAAERDGDLETLIGTLGPDTNYHFYELGGDIGPKTRDGVAAYYTHLVENNGHILEFHCDTLVVDDDCIVIEGDLTMIQPGELIVENPAMAPFCEAGKTYLLKLRNVIFWRYDVNLMIIGEDAYSGGPVEMRELSDGELPADYRALL